MTAALLRQAPRFATRIDGYAETPCNDFGWLVQFAYHIKQHGKRGHAFSRGDGMERDDGVPHIVKIVSARAIGPNKGPGLDVPLYMFSADDLAEREQIIADELDLED